MCISIPNFGWLITTRLRKRCMIIRPKRHPTNISALPPKKSKNSFYKNWRYLNNTLRPSPTQTAPNSTEFALFRQLADQPGRLPYVLLWDWGCAILGDQRAIRLILLGFDD